MRTTASSRHGARRVLLACTLPALLLAACGRDPAPTPPIDGFAPWPLPASSVPSAVPSAVPCAAASGAGPARCR